MMLNSSDDDLPDIPMVSTSGNAPQQSASAATALREDQMKRLESLEEQFRLLREEMCSRPEQQPPGLTLERSTVPRGSSSENNKHNIHRGLSGSSERCEPTAKDEISPGPEPAVKAPLPTSPLPDVAVTGLTALSDPTADLLDEDARGKDESDTLRDQEIQYELRRLAPHLSAEFTCSYRDAVLLIGAIRNGGSGVARGQESLMDRVTASEAERRSLDMRLAKKTEECEALRLEVDHARQKLRAVQQQAQQSTALLSQKREEMRKQLLMEESRTEKIQMKNRKLEKENEELKSRLRTHMR